MEEGETYLGLFLFSIDMAFSGAISAAFGMLASTIFMTVYTSAASVIIFVLVASRIVEDLHLPAFLNPGLWMNNTIINDSSPWKTLFAKGIVCIFALLLFSILGMLIMKRRVEIDQS